jgi:hypothetical protein
MKQFIGKVIVITVTFLFVFVFIKSQMKEFKIEIKNTHSFGAYSQLTILNR